MVQVGIKFTKIQDTSTVLLTKDPPSVLKRVNVTKLSFMIEEMEFVVNMDMENTVYTGTVRKIVSSIVISPTFY